MIRSYSSQLLTVAVSTVNEIGNEQLYAPLPNGSFLFVGTYCARDLLQNTVSILALIRQTFLLSWLAVNNVSR